MIGEIDLVFSRSIASTTKKGKRERKAQGLYNGLLSFGVTKEPHGLPMLDRETRNCDVVLRREIVPAEGLELAFALAAGCKSDREIARALNDANYRTSGSCSRRRSSKTERS